MPALSSAKVHVESLEQKGVTQLTTIPFDLQLYPLLRKMRSLLPALGAVLVTGVAVSPGASYAASGFVGPWDPSGATFNGSGIQNSYGFNRAVQSVFSTFTVSVSPDKQTLTAWLANNGDTNHPSFFLENYSGLLPRGTFTYDYSITLSTPTTNSVTEFDDFGRSASGYADGTVLTGQHSGLNPDPTLPYPFFQFFGINIDDGEGTASAKVVLTNFNFTPATVPGPLPIFGVAAAYSFSRRLRANLRQTRKAAIR
jgi:hypothetical protein